MKVDLSKKDLGFLYCALNTYIRTHRTFSELKSASLKEMSIEFKELHDMAELCIKIDSLLKSKVDNQ